MDILTDDLAAAGIRISPSGRVTYPESYVVYGQRFGKKPRAIREWVATGKSKGELPPLHDPAQLVTWWRRCKKTRVPPEILAMVSEESEPEAKSGLAPEKFSEEVDENGRATAGDDLELEGAEESLRQARELANEAYKKLKHALASGDPGGAEMWRKDWTSAVETQRKWEKDFNKIQEDRGLLVRKSMIQVEIAAVANVLQRGFLATMEDLLKNHAPELPNDDRRMAAVAARDKCFEVLRSGYFGENLFEAS